MATRARAVLLLTTLCAACGGGGPTSPGGGPGGTPSPPAGSPVTGYLFYDENGNGAADGGEIVRLPSVGVTVGGQTATTAAGGRFSLASVPNGAQTAQARAETLPAYFTSPGVSVTVPASADVPVPARLALGARNRPNVYLAFGDSITFGTGSSDDQGYVDDLRAQLRSFWGRADMVNDGQPATRSSAGEARIPASLAQSRPAYALILYGTNDWNEPECRNEPPCFTIDALRSMIQDTRSAGAHPIVGTIPPVNPSYADRNAAERNDWVRRMNDLIRPMAAQERAQVAEIHGDFLKQPSLPPLFFDFLHPNDLGYALISQSFFRAITQPLPGAAAALDGAGPVLFVPPGPRP
jgi:lysophospholipase L1-like esterase